MHTVNVVEANEEESKAQKSDPILVYEALQAAILSKIGKSFSDADSYAQGIADIVMKELERNSKEVLLSMIGFSQRWGGQLEIDHCNGRAGQSVIGDLTRTTFKDAAIKFIEANADQIFIVTKEEKEQIVKELRAEFKNILKLCVKQEANRAASNFLEEETKKIVEEFKEPRLLKIAQQLNQV